MEQARASLGRRAANRVGLKVRLKHSAKASDVLVALLESCCSSIDVTVLALAQQYCCGLADSMNTLPKLQQTSFKQHAPRAE